MTAPLRPAPADAADAPRDPITWVSVRRTLLIAGLIGVFLSFVRAFGSGEMAFLPRTAFMVALSWAGSIIGLVTFRLVARLAWTRNHRLLQSAVSATLMTPVMTLVVWGATQILPGGGAEVRELPGYLGITFVMCQTMSLFAVFMNMRAAAPTVVVAQEAAPPPKFLDRLPPKLRGAEVWAVEAEDHYLRLHTSRGQDLILMRLADAVVELEGLEGAQVHRSWWVSRQAIAEARRGDGRATLTLQDGSEVPVSRTYARLLRERGWI